MIDAVIYFVLLGVFSAIVSYAVIFRIAPAFGKKSGSSHPDMMLAEHGAPLAPHPTHVPQKPERHTRTFSAYEGFKSFARGPELTVEDVVKGLSRKD